MKMTKGSCASTSTAVGVTVHRWRSGRPQRTSKPALASSWAVLSLPDWRPLKSYLFSYSSEENHIEIVRKTQPFLPQEQRKWILFILSHCPPVKSAAKIWQLCSWGCCREEGAVGKWHQFKESRTDRPFVHVFRPIAMVRERLARPQSGRWKIAAGGSDWLNHHSASSVVKRFLHKGSVLNCPFRGLYHENKGIGYCPLWARGRVQHVIISFSLMGMFSRNKLMSTTSVAKNKQCCMPALLVGHCHMTWGPANLGVAYHVGHAIWEHISIFKAGWHD